MRGTFAFCRTKEAIKRMQDGDIIQNLISEQYFKIEDGLVYVSTDCYRWADFVLPMETFPPYEEWKSISNLHYYEDLKCFSIPHKAGMEKHFKSSLLRRFEKVSWF